MPDIFNDSSTNKPSETKPNSQTKSTDDGFPLIKPKNLTKERKQHNFPGHSHNPLSAFCYYPDRVKFVNEDPEERIILLLRSHPITNIKWIAVTFIMVIAPAFLSASSIYEALPGGFKVMVFMIWYLITLAFAFEHFLDWFFHVNIITDERIIEVDFDNLIYREITDADTEQIQDVTVEMVGAVRTFFNYGDIFIQTASEVPRIDFEAVPKPDMVAKVLRQQRVEEEVERLEGRIR